MSAPDLPEYPYAGPQRLGERRPYSFAPFAGAAFLSAFERSRSRLEHELGAAATSRELVAAVDHLSRDAHALRPEVQSDLAERMERLHLSWEVESARQATDTAEILDEILLPYVRAKVPLRARTGGPGWAHDVLLQLLERFEVYGCVHASYDRHWRKAESSPNAPAVLVRLALGAGWLSWSDLLVDPASALAHVNTLLKILDLVSAGVLHDGWRLDAAGCDAALAALHLERRLLRHWKRDEYSRETLELH